MFTDRIHTRHELGSWIRRAARSLRRGTAVACAIGTVTGTGYSRAQEAAEFAISDSIQQRVEFVLELVGPTDPRAALYRQPSVEVIAYDALLLDQLSEIARAQADFLSKLYPGKLVLIPPGVQS